ncbi:MAG TPA: mechanosensitive ion channel family protein [Blastocatellia bacterium]
MDTFLDKLKSDMSLLARDLAGVGEKIFAAILIVTAGIVTARIIRARLTRAIPERWRMEDSLLENFLLRVSYSSIVGLSFVLALRLFVNIETFLTGLGVTGVILGFGLRDTLSNFASGVLLLIYRPFRAGEMIDIEGTTGTVEELTIVNMEMTTVDGVRVIMPNSRVWGTKITNYSMSKLRRLELSIKLKPDLVKPAIPVLESALENDSRVVKQPKPAIRISSFADDGAVLTIWAWVAPSDYNSAMSNAYLLLLDALQTASISVA